MKKRNLEEVDKEINNFHPNKKRKTENGNLLLIFIKKKCKILL